MSAGALLDVHVLVRRGEEILFVERAGTGFMDGFHSLVGGRVEPGETFVAAAIREAWEEVGLAITEAELTLHAVVQKFGARERASVVFDCPLADGREPTNREPDRCARLVWGRAAAPPSPLVPYIALVLAREPGTPAGCLVHVEP